MGRAVPQRSLPPCGGGTGRGVATKHRARDCSRFANDGRLHLTGLLDRRYEPKAALLYPPPCPSPTRGEGTLWNRSAHPQQTHLRAAPTCALALPRGRTTHTVFSVVTSSAVNELIAVWKSIRVSAPVSASGQGIALIPFSSIPSVRGGWRADKAHGLDRQTGDGTACGRALGVKHHAPRLAARQRGIFGLRLSQRSGHARSSVSLTGFSRGRPWVESASTPARRCRSRSPFSRRLMKTPSTTDRDECSL
jgi:hypothetical protein